MSSRKTSSTPTATSSSRISVLQYNYQCCGSGQGKKKSMSAVCCKHGRPCARASPVKHAQRRKKVDAASSGSVVASGHDGVDDDSDDGDNDNSGSSSFSPISSQAIPDFKSSVQAYNVIIKKFTKAKHKKQSYFANAPSIPISPTVIENKSPPPSVESFTPGGRNGKTTIIKTGS